jgi:DNA topoisomerase-1
MTSKKIPAVPQALRAAARRNERPEGEAFAAAAGLEWVNDSSPGIARMRKGEGFVYQSRGGKTVKDEKTLARIRSLVIPPAWENVWICASARGHIQATGIDARGRKQYRYHPLWRSTRDATKFDRMMAFGKALPGIRKKTSRHLKLPGLKREKVLAAVVVLLEKTLIRVGNDEYARDNNSFGLTTLKDRHAKVRGGRVDFHFRGKSGVEHEIELHDARLARVVQECQEIPNQELFSFLDADSGKWVDVTSSHVNEYLKEIAEEEFTAKDFRTWAGTVMAAVELRGCCEFESESAARKNIVAAVTAVSRRLGNTKTVCRKCYIHPVIFETYLARELAKVFENGNRAGNLTAEEAAVMRLLENCTPK